MKKDGIASLIIAMGGKSKGGSQKEGMDTDASEKSAAVGDIWEAIKADDKEAFIDAVESYSMMCRDDD